jgi:hypothetical protein
MGFRQPFSNRYKALSNQIVVSLNLTRMEKRIWSIEFGKYEQMSGTKKSGNRITTSHSRGPSDNENENTEWQDE